jgi:hypothetical protein
MYQTILFSEGGTVRPLHIEYKISENEVGFEALINGECNAKLLLDSVDDFYRKDIQANFNYLKVIALGELNHVKSKIVHEYEMDISDLRKKVIRFFDSKLVANKQSVYELFSDLTLSKISYFTFSTITSKKIKDEYFLLVDSEMSRIYGELYKNF